MIEVCDICGNLVNTKALKTIRVIGHDQGRKRTMRLRVCERCLRLRRVGGKYYICEVGRKR